VAPKTIIVSDLLRPKLPPFLGSFMLTLASGPGSSLSGTGVGKECGTRNGGSEASRSMFSVDEILMQRVRDAVTSLE
jgi:hypothetical protein